MAQNLSSATVVIAALRVKLVYKFVLPLFGAPLFVPKIKAKQS